MICCQPCLASDHDKGGHLGRNHNMCLREHLLSHEQRWRVEVQACQLRCRYRGQEYHAPEEVCEPESWCEMVLVRSLWSDSENRDWNVSMICRNPGGFAL